MAASGEVGVPDQDVLEQELEELLQCVPRRRRDACVCVCREVSAPDGGCVSPPRAIVAGTMRR